jgi:fimbrial chaperone protein
MQKLLRPLACVALLAALWPSLAAAFKVSPMVQDFALQGREATHSFVVENTTPQEIAIEVQLKKRGYDAQGEETRSETKDFSVYPPQFTLKAGSKRLVRASYVGATDLKQEEAYRLIFQQLPVDFRTKGNSRGAVNIDVLLRYVASIYANPEGTRGHLEIADFSVQGKKLRATIRNSGSAHEVLSKIGLRLVSKDKSFDVPAARLEKILGAENLLPGMKKSYEVTLDTAPEGAAGDWKLQLLAPEGRQP